VALNRPDRPAVGREQDQRLRLAPKLWGVIVAVPPAEAGAVSEPTRASTYFCQTLTQSN
jgi:hypothetical protein